MLKNQKGFTLIELLIVIVIIGILAGVLIAIINPAQQQNRARDANVKATMNKVSLAAEGFISAYGRAPNDVQFLGSLQNAAGMVVGAADTCIQNDNVCTFTVTGNELAAASCDPASGWSGTGVADCGYHYYASTLAGAEDHFKVFAKSYGIADTVFMYDNKLAEIVECPSGAVGDSTGVGSCN